jgi:GGDEF domain-containing protein
LRRAEELDRTLNNAHSQWDGQQIPIQASCGVHMYASNAEVEELLESADAAMYKIKQQRRMKTGTDPR